MSGSRQFVLMRDSVMRPYTESVAEFCNPFICQNKDLDDFLANDAFAYTSELIGKTYAWISRSNPRNILGIVTLANDSVKSHYIAGSARNRIQRGIPNAKRGLNLPAVLIGRLGVSAEYRGKGMNIGTQILDFIKDWFRSDDNKTGCRFIVVDAYNNSRTMHFYEKNGFKPLYKTEDDEREFLGLSPYAPMDTRFMFFDLKRK